MNKIVTMNKIVPGAAILAILLWGSTAISALSHAQQNESVVRQPIIGTEPLTDETLKQMLIGLGYEPKPLSKGFLISIKQDTWTLNLQTVLSANREKLGLNANAGSVEDPASVSASDWMKLLISNGEIEPTTFYFDKDQKKLYLHRVSDNRGVTPAILRQEIDRFCKHIRDTGDLWKFTK